MASQLYRHHDALAEMIDALGRGHHQAKCPVCKGTGRAPWHLKRDPATRISWWRRLVWRIRLWWARGIVHQCRRCHGYGRVPLERGDELAMRMAMELEYLWRALCRLEQADLFMRRNGLRLDQAGTVGRHRP